MMSVSEQVDKSAMRGRVHPYKFALWISIVSMLMFFAALTSAYLVRKAQGNWYEFPIPTTFYWSVGVILLSSLFLHISYLAYLRGREGLYKSGLVLAIVFGAIFFLAQYFGWLSLYKIGIYMDGNPSGSFLFVLMIAHGAHAIGGLATLFVTGINAFTRPFKVTPLRTLRFSLVLTFWHFVDILWVYLVLFVLTQ